MHGLRLVAETLDAIRRCRRLEWIEGQDDPKYCDTKVEYLDRRPQGSDVPATGPQSTGRSAHGIIQKRQRRKR